jgi:hypothetical protein
MDNKLKALDPLQEKVATLEASMEELGNQHVTLTAAIERVDIAHTAVNAKVNRVKMGQRAPAQDQPPTHGCRRHGDNDADHGGDFIPTSHKLEFPKYDGTGFAAFYLLDAAQLWFHRMVLNGGRPTWPQFIQLMNARFGPPLTDSPIRELAMLQRTGTVDECSKRFIALLPRHIPNQGLANPTLHHGTG